MKGDIVTDSAPIYRAAIGDIDLEGRTLLGLAVPWDTPALVRDVGKPAYWEAFDREVFTRSLDQQPWGRPFYWHHEYRRRPEAEPIGLTDFAQSSEGLVFRSHVSKTPKGDRYLSLYKEGIARAVSVGAEPLTHEMRRMAPAPGPVLVRTEAKLLELSLTTKGQYADAKVLVMRSAPDATSFSEIGEAVVAALTAAYFPTSPDDGPYDAWVCLEDISDDWVVYSLYGNVDEDSAGLWRRGYDMAEDDTVTLADAEQVELTYTPVSRAADSLALPEWLVKAQRYRAARGF